MIVLFLYDIAVDTVTGADYLAQASKMNDDHQIKNTRVLIMPFILLSWILARGVLVKFRK